MHWIKQLCSVSLYSIENMIHRLCINRFLCYTNHANCMYVFTVIGNEYLCQYYLLVNFHYYKNKIVRQEEGLLNVDIHIRCNGLKFWFLLSWFPRQDFNFYPFKSIYVRIKWKKNIFEVPFSYHGNTIRLFEMQYF